jgi:hypothetical protein
MNKFNKFLTLTLGFFIGTLIYIIFIDKELDQNEINIRIFICLLIIHIKLIFQDNINK